MSKLDSAIKLKDTIIDDIYGEKKSMIGKILTHMEAFIQDPEQRKSAKDVIKDMFWAENYQAERTRNLLAKSFVELGIIETNEELDRFLGRLDPRVEPMTIENIKSINNK